jgi:sirohydrochlorin ferrochelatase
MLLGAGHAKSDVPAIVVEGRQRHPNVDVVSGGPLGVARVLVEVLGEGVIGAGGQGAPLLVIARGTSDPDANGDAAKAARLVAEWTGAPFVSTAFTGVTGPSVGEGLAVFEQLGFERFAVVFWFLCTGRLVDRAREEIGAFGRRTGRDIVDAGYIGPDARVAALLAERYRSARAGAVAAQNCDLCAYRAPWPGLEERVGMPVGVGHSHLAAEHLHAGHAHAHVHPS